MKSLHQRNALAVLVTGVIFFFFFMSIKVFPQQKALGGDAVFPTEYYQKWQTAQNDPNLSEEEKIKATVNTFFVLKFESWKIYQLLDFGFLFDKENPKAYDDYAYERGIHLMGGISRKYWRTDVDSYSYDPEFPKLEIKNQMAVVRVYPKSVMIDLKTPDYPSINLLTQHDFELLKKVNGWLIQSIFTNDEIHDSYPRTTDFVKEAATFVDRQNEFHFRGYRSILDDPKYKSLKNRFFKMSGFKESDLEKLKAICLFFIQDIAGKYVFKDIHGKDSEITFFPKEIMGNPQEYRFLCRVKGEQEEYIYLTEKPLEFGGQRNTRFNNVFFQDSDIKDRSYVFTFIFNDLGIITGCNIASGFGEDEQTIRAIKTLK